MQPIGDSAQAFATGRATSRSLTEAALAHISDSSGEGKPTFIRVFREAALAEAAASDQRRRAGILRSPLEELPISIKDICDVKGYATLAGSVVLRDSPAAAKDAPVVARLRAAGAAIADTAGSVRIPEISRHGDFSIVEGYAWHRSLLEQAGDRSLR